jgi:hypothetical protein
MKKIITLSFLCIFIISGWSATAGEPEKNLQNTMIQKNITLSFSCLSKPMVVEKEGSAVIELTNKTSQLIEPNKPILPIIIKTIQVPSGSTNIQVTCEPCNISTMTLTKKIKAACVAPLTKIGAIQTTVTDESIYNSSEFYPQSWYHATIGAGRIISGNRAITVKIVCYPVRYSPANNQIEYTNAFDIDVTYDEPRTPALANETYDLVIIAPTCFKVKLQPLIDFKNSKGLRTAFQAVEDILDHYTGSDPPEQVKYFIKDAYDTWGIQYVLLVGGLKSHLYANDKDTASAGWTAWWVPVRYVNIPQDEDEGCLSDLYYGCLYNATGGFDSWDSNNDGIYAAWNSPGAQTDTFDLYPEVAVGRLPVTNKRELGNIVQKIITYERTGPEEKPWYKNFIGIGGKTFGYYQGKPDGEYLCDLSYNLTKQAIPNLTLVPVYTTNKNTSGFVPTTNDIQRAISQGAGFIDFAGHGSPLAWDTIWYNGSYPYDWCGGITLYNFLRLSNKQKLPIVVVGGCHNGLYNVSLLKTLRDKTGSQYFTYGVPLPVCFSWGLVLKYPGGAIASTGCTGFGMGYQGNPVSLSAELETNFFSQIGTGSTTLGQAFNGAIQKFLDEEEINQVEAFVITNWALFGDPSLRLGGYP